MTAMCILIFTSILLLIFACTHWHNWWSFFVVLPCLVAFFWPALFFGYDDEDTARQSSKMDPDTLRNCRELSWALSALLLMGAYGIPVLAWYNAGFHWHGVLVVDGALTGALWAFVLWLRVFVISSE